MSLVQLYKRDEYGFFSVKPSNYLMAVTMPHILERYDSLVKPIDDDIFIGVCSMQLFEGINRPVKKAFKNQFNGRFDPATLLKNSLIFYRPNFIMTPSIGTQLQELSEPASLVRVLAGQNLVPTHPKRCETEKEPCLAMPISKATSSMRKRNGIVQPAVHFQVLISIKKKPFQVLKCHSFDSRTCTAKGDATRQPRGN